MQIEIGNYGEWHDALYITSYSLKSKKTVICLLNDSEINFSEDIDTFIEELSHEIIHQIIAKLFNFGISRQLDDLRYEFPNEMNHFKYLRVDI